MIEVGAAATVLVVMWPTRGCGGLSLLFSLWLLLSLLVVVEVVVSATIATVFLFRVCSFKLCLSSASAIEGKGSGRVPVDAATDNGADDDGATVAGVGGGVGSVVGGGLVGGGAEVVGDAVAGRVVGAGTVGRAAGR